MRLTAFFAGLFSLCLFAGLPLANRPVLAADPAPAEADGDDGWISLFDGLHLTDWEANEKANNWTVEDGCIVGRGSRSHLFFKGAEFEDLEFKAEAKLNKGGNSGMYFRTEFGLGWPKGYEAQVNNSHTDPKRTGTLYNFVEVRETLIPDNTWWTQHITAIGNHITIKVNDKVVVDFTDDKNTHTKGYIALQQHDPGSVVHYRNLKVKPISK
ncbi:MAG: DUF1080 domain-containing protein [Pirellulales bacterium]